MSSPHAQGARDDAAALRARLVSTQPAMAEGRHAEVEPVLAGVYADALAAGLEVLAGDAALRLAQSHFNADQTDAATLWSRRAREAARRADRVPMEAVAGVVLASARAQANDPVGAIEAVLEALALPDDGMSAVERQTLHIGVGATYGSLGLSRHAIDAARRALEAESAAGSVRIDRLVRQQINVLSSGLNAVDDLQAAGEQASSAALLDELLALVPPITQAADGFGPGWMRFSCAHAAGSALSRSPRLPESFAYLQAAVDEVGDVPPAERHAAWISLADAQARAGDVEAARRSAERAVPLVQGDPAFDPPRAAPYALRQLSRRERLRGHLDTALDLQPRLHARVLFNTQAALDAQVAGLTRRLSEATLRLQNADLRELNARLAADVADISRAAHTDALTGLPNRRSLQTAFENLRQHQADLVVVMIDVDHFKSVNDRHSHLIGDAVLREAAAVMADALRAPDRLGRYGGEEFMALLDGIDTATAQAVAERLRQRIQAHDWSTIAPGLALTVSAGVAEAGATDSFEQAVGRADLRLYRAKQGGRNRVVGSDG